MVYRAAEAEVSKRFFFVEVEERKVAHHEERGREEGREKFIVIVSSNIRVLSVRN